MAVKKARPIAPEEANCQAMGNHPITPLEEKQWQYFYKHYKVFDTEIQQENYHLAM